MNQLLKRKLSQYLLAFAAVIVLVAGWMYVMADPNITLLVPRHSAQWMGVNKPFDPAKFDVDTTAIFETDADFGSLSNLEVTALRHVRVFVDGEAVFDSGPNLSQWKTVYSVPVAAGRHRLRCVVFNQRGPSMLRVSGCWQSWRASVDGQNWTQAVPATQLTDPRLPPQFGSTSKDFLRLSPLWGGIFIIAFGFCFVRSLNGSIVRWVALGAWVLMAANNIMKVPLGFGYDADSHYRYIQYVADHFSLPRPDGGWQYFQSPMYYILSAGLDRLLILSGVGDRSIPYLLRFIPLACGAAMIDLCYRASRVLFPARSDLQAITTLVGGLLPVNIYMSQAVSNEPLGAVVSAWITLLALKMLVEDDSSTGQAGRPGIDQQHAPFAGRSPAFLPGLLNKWMVLGVALGVGLLTKINILLWAVPVGSAITAVLFSRHAALIEWTKSILVTAATTLIISGGWFVRNLIMVHRPFYLESSAAHDPWWQDPGYRTPQMFYEFGHVFARPIYNGLFSVWDSLYGTLWGNGIPTGQPPWNYGLMSCGLWLGLVPTTAVLLGIYRVIVKKPPHLWFALLALGCFLAAVLYVYLTLPIYSCAKASYLMGTAPCIGLLAAAGFDCVMKNRWLRAGVGGAVICWAAVGYLAYFAFV